MDSNSNYKITVKLGNNESVVFECYPKQIEIFMQGDPFSADVLEVQHNKTNIGYIIGNMKTDLTITASNPENIKEQLQKEFGNKSDRTVGYYYIQNTDTITSIVNIVLRNGQTGGFPTKIRLGKQNKVLYIKQNGQFVPLSSLQKKKEPLSTSCPRHWA